MCGNVGKGQRFSGTEGKRIVGTKRLHPHSGDKQKRRNYQRESFESASALCPAHPCVCTAPPGWKTLVHFSLVPALAVHPWQQQLLIFQSTGREGVSGTDGLLHMGAEEGTAQVLALRLRAGQGFGQGGLLLAHPNQSCPARTPVPQVLLWNRGGSAARIGFSVRRAPASPTALHTAWPPHTCRVP